MKTFFWLEEFELYWVMSSANIRFRLIISTKDSLPKEPPMAVNGLLRVSHSPKEQPKMFVPMWRNTTQDFIFDCH